MKDKIDPYLQPIYDALEDMIPATQIAGDDGKAYYTDSPTGHSCADERLVIAVVILDEAQNTTSPR